MQVSSALLSVSDKRGIVDFARSLLQMGVKLYASGGTALALRDAGLAVTSVEQLTGAPEILGGRVKTLHPAVHGGILSRRSAEDRQQLAQFGWGEIDLVAVNLYPFEALTADPNLALADAIEAIDIGGVALLRAAAKNFEHVAAVCDPDDYQPILQELSSHGQVSLDLRRRLALKVFRHTSTYDAAIQRYLDDGSEQLPNTLALGLHKVQEMRYGENPHQSAALYAERRDIGPLTGRLLHGKALSYNNLLDLDAAWWTALSFERPTAVFVKHLSPCGIASNGQLQQALTLALASDPVSAFGGVVACNRPFDHEAVQALGKLFVEAIVAPSFTPDALQLLQRREACRLVAVDQAAAATLEVRSILGGYLVQQRDAGDQAEWQLVTRRAASPQELAALKFAWRAVAHVKSNAIVLAQGEHTVGIGGGQPSRVDSVKTAIAKAGDRARSAVLASDAFFPFADGLEEAGRAGVTAVVQPGGSIHDKDVIAAADELGLAMYFTGVRHFRH